MNFKTLFLAALSGLLLTACIPSVYPFYTEREVVFEKKVIGEWRVVNDDKQPEHWNFAHSRNSHYDLTVTDNEGKTGEFRATMFKLDDELFLDLMPTDCEYASSQNDLVSASMFPGHLLVHVSQLEPELRMSFCDFDWLGDYLEENPKALAHRRSEHGMVLTGTTRELQRFVIKHLKEGKLFDDYGTLKKQTYSDQPASQ